MNIVSAEKILNDLKASLYEVDRLRRLVSRLQIERDIALDQLGLEDVEHGPAAVLAVGLHDDVVAGEVQRRANAFEVVALGDLLLRLGEGVGDLLAVDLADDVERAVGHGVFPSVAPRGCGARLPGMVEQSSRDGRAVPPGMAVRDYPGWRCGTTRVGGAGLPGTGFLQSGDPV